MFSARAARPFARFKSDLSGSTAMLFGLSAVPMLMLVAAGVDYSRAVDQKSQLQQANDATALAITRSLSTTTDAATLQQQAQKYLAAAVNDPNAVITSGPTVSSNNTAICISSKTTLRATMMQVAVGMGFAPPSTLTVSANSCTKISDVTYEIALALDNSGSMNESTSGTTKIASLQTAAQQMVSTLNPVPTAPRASFAIVPFSSAVKIGSQYAASPFMDTGGQSSIHWQNFALPAKATAPTYFQPTSKFDLYNAMGVTWGGCVEERPNPYMTTDTAASSATPDTLFVPYLYPDEHKSTYISSSKTYSLSSSSNTYISLDSNNNAGTCQNNDYYDLADQGTSATPINNTVGNTVWNATQTEVCKYNLKTKNQSVLSGLSTFGSGFNVGPNLLCDSQQITTLTNDNTVLSAAIKTLYAKGDTNLISGFMWGWRTISPNGPFNTQTTATSAVGNQNAKSYAKSGTALTNVKVIILMTDGFNHWAPLSNDSNNSAYSSLGFYNNGRLGATSSSSYRSMMDAQTLQACTNAKAAGVQIYTVGFSIPSNPIDAAGLSLLQSCATNTNMAYIAQDGSALISTFQSIAQQMSALRLTH